MAGGLTIKISADTASAQRQFEALAASSSSWGDKLDKANKKFAASVEAYQSKMEALMKSGLSPMREAVKKCGRNKTH